MKITQSQLADKLNIQIKSNYISDVTYEITDTDEKIRLMINRTSHFLLISDNYMQGSVFLAEVPPSIKTKEMVYKVAKDNSIYFSFEFLSGKLNGTSPFEIEFKVP